MKNNNEKLLIELKRIMKWKKGKSYYAKKLNISESYVEILIKQLKENKTVKKSNIRLSGQKKVDVLKGTFESSLILDFEPKNETQLALLHKIDLKKFIITNYWSKLLPNGKFTSSVFSKKKEAEDYTSEDFYKFLKNYQAKDLIISEPFINKGKELIDVELSISDYHLAKKYVNGNNNVDDRVKAFYNIAQDLIKKVKNAYNIDTVIFPISNDFFHTDNYQNQTTNGTPQDVIMTYDSEYEAGFDLLVKTISMLKRNCNYVKVVLVQGNHDKTKSFYLAHALDIYFSKISSISFIRQHSTVKAVIAGNTFIGYHHGNCKIEDLPLLFATHPEYGKLFGEAKFREVHTGDKHHYMAKEVKGVRIQQMPSLSDSDRWHKDNNYVHSIRAALLLGYNKSQGKECEFEKRI